MRAWKIAASYAAAAAIGQIGAMLWPSQAEAQQEPQWRELGGVNGVELYEVRTPRATCYVTSAGGVWCR